MKPEKICLFGLIVIMLLFSACTPVLQSTAENSTAQTTQISVTGTGVVYAVPDLAYINVGVRSQADTVAEALELNNTQAKAIKDTLVSQGVNETDIQTSSFNVYPLSDYDYEGNVSRTYFSVENNVYVMVRNLDNLGAILDAVAASGANNIYGISFNLLDKAEAQSTARQLAVESAILQAQELANAAGVEVGELLAISSAYSNPIDSYSYYGMGGGGDYASISGVPTTAGQIQINANVTMTFAIE